MEYGHFVWLVIGFPLLGALINGFVVPKDNKKLAHIIGSAALISSFICALLLFIGYASGDRTTQIMVGFDWITAGSLKIPFALVVDQLSAFMALMVTTIASLIHIYAGGYMHEEKETWRFFSYLNLFVFMMLLLVLGDNLIVMFMGWEGVGLCSYLLIGYWYDNLENATAGMKAFLVNRIGDIGFLIGIFLCYKYFGTVSFTELREIATSNSLLSEFQLVIIGWITLALFIGACGKSAQMPLYVWLPDAMAGPTPVSALIHAATMVTAGIYMMSRMSFFYYLAPETQMVVAIVGAITALFAATIAIVQTDIKKVLAYSTVSQLGYMVMACGVGAYGAGMFHVFTHACFKALLFMGAGSVIVAMHHKQDMLEMGGLKKYMPITHKVFLVGVLAIIGFPGLSGFFSKDEILWQAYIGGESMGLGPLLWVIGVIAACCTAFYMVRLLMLTFYGENRSDEHTREHLHETSPVMWAPLVVLAAFAVLVGYLNVPEIIPFPVHKLFDNFLAPVLSIPNAAINHWGFKTEVHSHALEYALMFISTSAGLASAYVAILMYKNGVGSLASKIANSNKKIYELLLNKYWVDEIYLGKIVEPIKEAACFLWKVVDVVIIDGFINSLAQSFAFVGGILSFRSTGSVHRYAMFITLGLVSMIIVLFFS